MSTRTPVEVTTRYATSVDDMTAAWAFVMARLDTVGPAPSVTIRPVWIFPVAQMIDALDGGDDDGGHRQFEVVVEGSVKEGT